MNVFDCTIVPVEARNIPAFLSECILSNTNCTNGLQFSSYATASYIPYNPIEHPVYNFLVSLYIYLFVFLNVQYIVEGSVARIYPDDCYEDWEEDEP